VLDFRLLAGRNAPGSSGRARELTGKGGDVVQSMRRAPSYAWASTSAGSPRDGSQVFLGLLGGFDFRLDGHSVLLPKTAMRVLAFMAFADRPVTRSYVAQSLWLDATERHADGNLRSALWKVGRFNGSVIQAHGGRLALGPDVAVDYRDATALANGLLRDPESCSEWALDEDLLARDLLPDWYDEWLVVERERFRQLRLHALETLCLELLARRRYGQAIQAGVAAVGAEPLRESANVVLIRAYLAEGNVGEAVRHYRSFRHLLWDELGVRPSPGMTRLMGELAER
jgi:DNA-binding SARP family transcriptional activator